MSNLKRVFSKSPKMLINVPLFAWGGSYSPLWVGVLCYVGCAWLFSVTFWCGSIALIIPMCLLWWMVLSQQVTSSPHQWSTTIPQFKTSWLFSAEQENEQPSAAHSSLSNRMVLRQRNNHVAKTKSRHRAYTVCYRYYILYIVHRCKHSSDIYISVL